MTILKLQEVHKAYKSQQVIDRVSLTIDEPGIWALVGPNGVGKTTLLNCICNITSMNSGKIELLGKSNKNYQVFESVSFLQDNSVLFSYLTGYDHLKYVCDVHRLSKERIQEVAEYVGMESYLHKKVGAYSLGMKQHLLLALSIINNPKLLFMDEPLNGLDPSSAILMRNILLDFAEKGTTIILSSHNLAEIDRITDQIIFLKDGSLIEVDRRDQLETHYIFKLSNHELAIEVLSNAGYVVQEEKDMVIVTIGEDELDNCIQLIHNKGISILDIQKEVFGSEKLYKKYFGKRG